jgi:FkbM family methyltransferase
MGGRRSAEERSRECDIASCTVNSQDASVCRESSIDHASIRANHPMIKRLAMTLAPRLIWRRRLRTWRIESGEDEAALLPSLTSRSKLSIDIGAAKGSYTAALIPLSRKVVAFEPTPFALRHLRQLFQDTRVVTIEAVALSDRSGDATMRFPRDSFWRSTIESRNELRYTPDIEEFSVRTCRLDDYNFRSVGFIKIDVEGHEMAVLNGAERTIAGSRPNMLVEVEEQHCVGAVAAVRDFFGMRNYEGFFLVDGRILPISRFSLETHQRISNLDAKGNRRDHYTYVNNFVFVPAERAASWLAGLRGFRRDA